ncbi:diadenylate cyclase CdaA [Rubeoparvulum massiliense]|uniref:diadenylate cyclase CdaA n=1 Tax=Rubeoparvulum massiliense TaxID=1631346 RepID=UPI00065E5C40|nr:diadenylate cyclase CdaA [Rubeoparvulum massiliense]
MDGVKEFFTVSLQYLDDMVDILIITFIIYKFLMLIRGTRAVQLLKGILVIFGVWLLSLYFNLRTLQWLMSEVFTLGVLGIIILFQPELRKGLEQLGRGRFFPRAGQMEEDQLEKVVNHITDAVTYMAKRRIGSLIILEQETGITEQVETGIPVDGNITSQLLINIFIPNTPLHDGAVIIRQDRIVAAACYLPLSENPTISKELGTRHRAALGITEISDAVAVVVSEETGQISICRNGHITRDYDKESLREALKAELTPENPVPHVFQRKGGEEQ